MYFYFLQRITIWCIHEGRQHGVLHYEHTMSTCSLYYASNLLVFQEMCSHVSVSHYMRTITIPAGQLHFSMQCRNSSFYIRYLFTANNIFAWLFELSCFSVTQNKGCPELFDDCIVALIRIIEFKSRYGTDLYNITVASTINKVCLLMWIITNIHVRTYLKFQVIVSFSSKEFKNIIYMHVLIYNVRKCFPPPQTLIFLNV